MRAALLAVMVAALPITAQEHHHGDVSPSSTAGEAPIVITVNPEARVSVLMAGAPPPPSACGTPVDLPVKIINQGFVTTRLEAALVGDAPPGVTLDFRPDPLRGVPEEIRTLRITLAQPGMVDLTVAFKAHSETPDLGGRDRVHFLLSCRNK